jgi:hypothetical protein
MSYVQDLTSLSISDLKSVIGVTVKVQQYLENVPYGSLVGIVTLCLITKLTILISLLRRGTPSFSVSSEFYVKGRYGQNFMSNVRVLCTMCALRLISDLCASC